MKDRKKASDIFNETESIFSKKVTFDEAFPHISDINMEIIESEDPIWRKEVRQHFFNIKTPPGEFVDCSNPICYSGGVSVGDILRHMVAEKKTDQAVTKKCRGYEGSPKGKRRYRRCMHSFAVSVKIKYSDISE